MVSLVMVACAACAAPFQRAATVVPPPGPERVSSTLPGASVGRRSASPSVAEARAASPMSVSFAGWKSTASRSTWPPERAWADWSAARSPAAWMLVSSRRSSRRSTGTRLFGASSFAHKNIRRKADARAYPSRLEFGLRGGIVPPAGLNSGEYVELLLGRIAAPYFDVDDFDDLPTPFRTVAVDLLSAQPVVMRRGLAGGCDARHHVASADLSTRGDRRPGADRRRDHEQRARGHRQGDGSGPRGRHQRRRSVRSRGCELHDVRRGGQHARCHDAGVNEEGTRRRRRRGQCPSRKVRIARLAARRRADR